MGLSPVQTKSRASSSGWPGPRAAGASGTLPGEPDPQARSPTTRSKACDLAYKTLNVAEEKNLGQNYSSVNISVFKFPDPLKTRKKWFNHFKC